MSAPITETIRQLIDSETAKIDIITTTGQTIRLNCVYKESDAPGFFLVFPPKILPDNINIDKPCSVSIKAGKTSLTLTAEISAVKGDRMLELIGKNSVKPESLRDYFRVDTKVPIKASFAPASPGSDIPSWHMEGTTLDLSGSGVLAIFSDKPQTNHKIAISIDLCDNQQLIECLGHIVRTKRLRKKRYQVAFHFDYIAPKSKDTIISYCLKEQRNQLRDKIQTID